MNYVEDWIGLLVGFCRITECLVSEVTFKERLVQSAPVFGKGRVEGSGIFP